MKIDKMFMNAKQWMYKKLDVDNVFECLGCLIAWLFVVFVVGSVILLFGFIMYSAISNRPDCREGDDFIETYVTHGEKHEYLSIGNSLSHIPNCIYCKEGQNEHNLPRHR